MSARAKEMSCTELVMLVSDYLEGGLSWRERRRFRKHLKACPPCVEYVAQMEQVIESMGAVPDEEVPPAVLDELLIAFRDFHRA